MVMSVLDFRLKTVKAAAWMEATRETPPPRRNPLPEAGKGVLPARGEGVSPAIACIPPAFSRRPAGMAGGAWRRRCAGADAHPPSGFA